MPETPVYERLAPEARILLDEALAHLAAHCDPGTLLVMEPDGGRLIPSPRNTLYYALGLLIRHGAERTREAEALVGTVLDLQLDDPGEIWHGTFRHPDEPSPPHSPVDWRRLSPDARYIGDRCWELVSARFSELLRGDPGLAPQADRLEALLSRALMERVPVAWYTYEPNLREFVGMVLAMLLEHFEPLLSPALVQRCERAAELLIGGAVSRVRAGLTPLNTNIRTMYVFVLDWFGARMGRGDWREEALREARALRAEYAELHAVAEYNSPTYCGVDLSTLGFWRRYSACAELRETGTYLEENIWRDMAAFYNPAMRNFSGPYSRCYEMDMAVHTCFCDILYLGLGRERFPWHPFSIESVINPLTILGDIRVPEDVVPLLTEERGERLIRRSFRELSERGDPRDCHALCAATAWITPEIMLGALSGSENPSGQLHPLTLFWRCGDALGTLCLRRCLPDGRDSHLHTVFFDGEAEARRARMEARNACPRPVDVYFEIHCPGLAPEAIGDGVWSLPGLTLRVEAEAPAPRVTATAPGTLRVAYPAMPGDRMRFRLECLPAGACP